MIISALLGMVRLTTSISIDQKLIHKIDFERGLANRSRYIEYLLNKGFENERKN